MAPARSTRIVLGLLWLAAGATPTLAAQSGKASSGRDLYQAACAACHGPDGNSAAPDFPKIAGQHYDYLLKALKDYKSGARKSPIMAPLVANLTQRDMEDLAAWYSSQRGLITKH